MVDFLCECLASPEGQYHHLFEAKNLTSIRQAMMECMTGTVLHFYDQLRCLMSNTSKYYALRQRNKQALLRAYVRAETVNGDLNTHASSRPDNDVGDDDDEGKTKVNYRVAEHDHQHSGCL